MDVPLIRFVAPPHATRFVQAFNNTVGKVTEKTEIKREKK